MLEGCEVQDIQSRKRHPKRKMLKIKIAIYIYSSEIHTMEFGVAGDLNKLTSK